MSSDDEGTDSASKRASDFKPDEASPSKLAAALSVAPSPGSVEPPQPSADKNIQTLVGILAVILACTLFWSLLFSGGKRTVVSQWEVLKETATCAVVIVYSACPLKPYFSKAVDIVLARPGKAALSTDISVVFERKSLMKVDMDSDELLILIGEVHKGAHCGFEPMKEKFESFDTPQGQTPAKKAKKPFRSSFSSNFTQQSGLSLHFKLRLFQDMEQIFIGVYLCGAAGNDCIAKLRLQDSGIEHRSYYLELYLMQQRKNISIEGGYVAVKKIDIEVKSLELNCSSGKDLPKDSPF